jgi:hypothetical protein
MGPGGSGLGACFDDVFEMNPREYGGFFFLELSFEDGGVWGLGRWSWCFCVLVIGFGEQMVYGCHLWGYFISCLGH